jgi:hypothetical protein
VNLVLSLSFFFFSYKLGTHRDFVTTVPLCLRNVPILSASQKESRFIYAFTTFCLSFDQVVVL